MEAKKNILTKEGLAKYEDELHELKTVKLKEVAEKLKEAREQGDLSENAEYDAAKDEQRDIAARIEVIEKILKNAEVIDDSDVDTNKISIGCTVKLKDLDLPVELHNEYDNKKDCSLLEIIEKPVWTPCSADDKPHPSEHTLIPDLISIYKNDEDEWYFGIFT